MDVSTILGHFCVMDISTLKLLLKKDKFQPPVLVYPFSNLSDNQQCMIQSLPCMLILFYFGNNYLLKAICNL